MDHPVNVEAAKLQQHLTLLKEEYVKLQNYCNELEKKCATASDEDISKNSFVQKLIRIIGNLFDKEQYSDIKLKLKDRDVNAHKFVLSARSTTWGVSSLDLIDVLDWTDLKPDVGLKLAEWVYTDKIQLCEGDEFTLDLMKAAGRFKLESLVTKCEQTLMATVGVHNCVKFYTAADEIGAKALKDHCSSLISTYWDDFTSKDFDHMSAHVLFGMFRAKTKHPLHSAIRLHREDVVFLYLVERSSEADGPVAFPNCEYSIPIAEI